VPRSVVKPHLSLHKRTGQARVRIDGKDFYCGLWGTREAHERGEELIREWILKRDPNRISIAVGELALFCRNHAEAYCVKTGRPASEVHTYRAGLGFVCRRFKGERAAEFSPLKLKTLRENRIRSQLTRQTIIKYQARILAVWKRAVSEELVKAEVWQALISSIWSAAMGSRKLPPDTAIRPATGEASGVPDSSQTPGCRADLRLADTRPPTWPRV
jgi:hypothetical protein